ncbi:Putative aliphatic sulfonates transport permease protein SsuC [Pigmentiphaga humi]|uniref:Aliphatic sulfonates transport permease protein SsuC n=1 Tax=Pigmentiphaga humi TaxID=2478468 RepID=A0A3P4B0R7_9BURK|nr:ABC transporter permease [Pigmentiphaga humi]VCU68715.1 Putative aliphatic sulfonates transport permease protein SsuC [Pigmentiphaga humi]
MHAPSSTNLAMPAGRSARNEPTPADAHPARTLKRGEGKARDDATQRMQKLLRLASPFLLLAIWELLARLGILDVRFFPPPSTLVGTAEQMLTDGSLAAAVADSMIRLVIGFCLGAVAGCLVGVCVGLSGWFRSLIEPWLIVTYPIPKLAIYPLLVLIVGLGDAPIVLLLAIAVFYIVSLNLTAGIASIRPVIYDVGRDSQASFMQIVLTIALPASLPHLFVALEIASGIAFIVLIAAEFVGAKTGLGSIIWSSWQLFDVGPMYVAILAISILGYLSTVLLRATGRLLMPWRRTHRV